MVQKNLVWSAPAVSLIASLFLAVQARNMNHFSFLSSSNSLTAMSTGWVQKSSQSVFSVEGLRGGSMGKFIKMFI